MSDSSTYADVHTFLPTCMHVCLKINTQPHRNYRELNHEGLRRACNLNKKRKLPVHLREFSSQRAYCNECSDTTTLGFARLVG